MRALGSMHLLLLLGCCLVRPASADIYTYVAPDGTVHLSNVPDDGRYRLLSPDEEADERVAAQAGAPEIIAAKARYDRLVDNVAREYGLESALLHAVISVESRYNPKAVSPRGAAGLMQLMPATAKRFGVGKPFDPMQNLRGGAKYLSFLLDLFNRDLKLALAAYNAGEGTVLKHGNRIPPIRETQKYVPQVLAFYRKYQAKL